MNAFEAICRKLSALALLLSGVGLVLMTALIGYQVFARYVLNDSPSWTEQLTLLTMLWFILFAAAAGVREGFHLRISLFESLAKGKTKLAVQLFGQASVFVFGVAMAVFGAELVAATWSHAIPALGMPRGVAYIPISLSGVLVCLFSLERALAILAGRDIEATWS
ncbi:MAG: TRAP transporter small permease [Henriciella sp.]|uniref:TRAP transporter small permease n=1 Tax=Henriciella sp. TaxID=1968823 RepID=UPI003C7174F2